MMMMIITYYSPLHTQHIVAKSHPHIKIPLKVLVLFITLQPHSSKNPENQRRIVVVVKARGNIKLVLCRRIPSAEPVLSRPLPVGPNPLLNTDGVVLVEGVVVDGVVLGVVDGVVLGVVEVLQK